jgi:uncharacterized integral membrane protein
MELTDIGAASGTATNSAAKPAKRAGVTVSPKMVVVAVIIVAAVWFALVNRASTRIHLWIPSVTAPMWLVLTITFGGGLLTGMLLTRSRKKSESKSAS